MAGNKKIFELPLRTGVTIDDRLAIVDSGNTTTYSVKVSDLRDGVGVNTLDGLSGDIVFSGTNIDISTTGQTIVLSASTGGGGGGGFIDGDATDSLVTKFMNPTGATLTNTTYVDNLYVSGTSIDFLYGQGEIGGLNSTFTRATSTFFTGGGLVFGYNNLWDSADNSVLVGGEGNDLRGSGQSGMIGGNNNNANCYSSFFGGGGNHTLTNASSRWNSFIGGYGNVMSGNAGSKSILGGYFNTLSNSTGIHTAIISGQYNTISNDGAFSTIINGENNTISGHSYSVILGGSGLTSNYDEEVLVPNLTIANYASLNYADDTAAAAGGIVLGQVYHNNGDLRIRIT